MQIASPLSRVICINWRRDAGAAPKMTHALEKTLSSKLTRAASLTMRRKTIRSRDQICDSSAGVCGAQLFFLGSRIIQIWFLCFGSLHQSLYLNCFRLLDMQCFLIN